MFKLYIDESGKNTLTKILSYAPHFSVAGILVHDLADDFIKRRADQIKFKYWGSTKITFHTNDMRNLKGDFSIFKGQPDLYYKFQTDFKEFIRCSQFKLIWVGTNKINYLDNNPPIKHVVMNNYSKQVTIHEKKLTQNTFRKLWEIYLCYLVQRKDASGQIIVEAADKNQDEDILSAYNKIMSAGVSSMNLSNHDIREHLTSISFVTKNNLDAETQLADLGSYYLSLNARIEESISYGKISNFDRDLITLLKQKIFTAKCNGLSQNSCQIMP